MEVSAERRMELAIQAQELLSSDAFKGCMKKLLVDAVGTLQQCSVGDLRASDAHATLRALNLIEASLKALASDRAVLEKQGKA